MRQPPVLTTPRLRLRPFEIADGPRVRLLAGDRRIYETTINIPHPYEDGMAERWIATHLTHFYEGTGLHLAVTLRDGPLIGACGLIINPPRRRAELGYWIGADFWGQGYCTEAARAVAAYGFDTLDLHRIIAHHFAGNGASGRVMEKIGMRKEGHLREHVVKDGVFHDVGVYGILAGELRES